MWLLHLLPDAVLTFVVNAVLIIGLVATLLTLFVINPLLRWFPPLARYVTLLQITSVLILAAGVYFKGGHSTEMMWRERVAELEQKLAKAETESKEANTKIETKVVTKTQVIKQRGEDIIKYVDREVVKYDNTCPIPKEFIKAHNDAAEAPKK